MCDAWRKKERRASIRNAELIVAIVNSQGGKLEVSDLIPPDPDEAEAEQEAQSSQESFLAFVQAAAKAQESLKHG